MLFKSSVSLLICCLLITENGVLQSSAIVELSICLQFIFCCRFFVSLCAYLFLMYLIDELCLLSL